VTDYVWRGGARLTPYMNYQMNRLDADLRRVFGVGLVTNSGIRTAQEQIDIFLSRYVTAGNVKGRHVYDTRWWNGQLWYRVSAAGTVAVPSTSNHEVQGNRAAVDIADTGATAGITVKSSARGQWLRRNAGNYDMVASGDGFGEGWHFDINNIFASVPGQPAGGGGTPLPAGSYTQEDSMIRIQAPGRGIALIGPGYYRPLATDEEVNNSGPLITPPGGQPWHYSGNERQFDLWVSMAFGGQSSQNNAVRGDAQNAATIASEVRNWIVDPDRGLLAAISKVSVDSEAINKAIQDALKDVDVNAEVTPSDIEAIATAAVDKLVSRAKD